MPKELSRKETARSNRTWQAHMKAWRHNGLTGKEYCRQYQLSYYAFIYWKKKLCSLPSTAVELVPVPARVHHANSGNAIKVEVGDRFKVEIPDDFVPYTLSRVIATLEAYR